MLPMLRILAMSLATVAASASAETVTLSSVRDNTLYEDPLGSLSNARGQHMFAGRVSSGGLRRALLKFDLSTAIPAGATITGVSLTLSMSRSIDGGSTVGLYRALADWGEGTSQATDQEGGGDQSTPGDATWVHTFFDSQLWTSEGGDFNPVASAARTIGGPGVYTWPSTPALVANVQGWLDDPASNFGWFIRGEEAFTRTAKRFDTRENADPALRPVLVIQFTPPPPPLCTGDADGNGVVDFADITAVLSQFGASYFPLLNGLGDADHDGFVRFADVTSVLANFNASCV